MSRLRIEEAKRLKTEQPELTMEDVAKQCGFASVRSFYRTFSREMDMTPTEWLSAQNHGDNS